MKNILIKSNKRNIVQTLGRYLSLIGVTFLGAGVLAGLLAVAPEMHNTADKYFESQNLMDVRIVSPLGYSENNIEQIEQMDEIENYYLGTVLDAVGSINATQYTIRVHSQPSEEAAINQLQLIEGRLPKGIGELVIVLPPDGVGDINVSDEIIFDTEDTEEILKTDTFTIVGIVESGLYTHNIQGNSSEGSGNIDFVLFGSPDSFGENVENEIYVKLSSAKGYSSFSSQYDQNVRSDANKIEELGIEQAMQRFEELEKEVLQAEDDFLSKKQDAERTFIETEEQLANAKRELENQKQMLSQSEAMLSDMEFQQSSLLLKEKEEEYKQAIDRFEEEKNRIENDLKDAENLIQNSKQLLEDIKQPQWYIETRNQNQGYAIYKGDAQSMAGLATIFPIIFFLVASLVLVTTMTRMIEEERLLIGTLKSFGYSNPRIMNRYLGYSLSASVIGSSIGVFVGFRTLPWIMWQAYSFNYSIPDIEMNFWWNYAVLAIGVMLLITTLVTYIITRKALKETAAALMISKAPPAGKRIFLEKISFIWRKLSFTQKVTQRNIFLDKKRMLMTIIGIIGSAALLVTGFGLRESADQFPIVQYEEIMTYDLDTLFTESEMINDEIEQLFLDKDRVEDYLFIREESIEIYKKGLSDGKFYINMVSAKEPADLTKFIHLSNQQNQIDFDENSVVLTHNIASILGISVGDKIEIKPLSNSDFEELEVTDISKNLEGNFLYISENKFAEIFQEAPLYNRGLLYVSNEFSGDELSKELSKLPVVKNVDTLEDKKQSLEENLSSITMIVIILIIVASMLAIVVLYNVTNINIEERSREIATLKVLGFYNSETDTYIFREIIQLTFMGSALGLVLGVFIFREIVQSIGTEYWIFGTELSWRPFLYAFTCIALYTFLVSLLMIPKIRKIDMLASLKSNE